MTQEDKELLIKDLCARLPYGVKVDVSRVEEWKELTLTPFILSNYYDDIEKIKPYLRPMSSMTEEEKEEYERLKKLLVCAVYSRDRFYMVDIDEDSESVFDWLKEHHFDYRGLIEKGLAIAVTNENNPYMYI